VRSLALVVGGSGGIGSAICRHLADHGARVVVGYHANEKAAAEVAASLAGDGHEVLQLAVTDPASLRTAASTLTGWHDCLDVLVNGAGVTRPVPHEDLEALDDELIDAIFATNWRGPFATIRAMRPLLDRAKTPVVVNISSIAATTGHGSNVAYCASKAALDSMTRSLGRALAPRIRMVSVAPGWVLGDYASRMPTEVLDAQRDATPMARLASADDVGGAVVAAAFLLPMTTGAVLPVDGGRPLGTS
jgi:3-oxoacyl-[acyl-carrier protein] reductase